MEGPVGVDNKNDKINYGTQKSQKVLKNGQNKSGVLLVAKNLLKQVKFMHQQPK